MYHYYFNRGLDVVEDLAKRFRDRHWILPDFICDEVLDTIFQYVDDYSYYNVNDDFSWEKHFEGGSKPQMFYAVAYFGKELYLGHTAPPNTIVIRDSVWMPEPFAPVEYNQIWFNSLRKIVRGAKGASVATHFRLGNNEVASIFKHQTMSWQEINHRTNNFMALQEFLPAENIISYVPQFPTLFPVRLKNRDEVLKKIEQPLPGMWKNKYKMAHPLYRELTFIPVDSRFDRDHVLKLAERMVEYDKK